MRDSFRAYFTPTSNEFEEIWRAADIVLDANALLNLFRYTPETREAFLETLTSFGQRVWLPHQVGLEYHRRRHAVLSNAERAFDEFETALTTARNGIATTLNKHKRHPSIVRESVDAELDLHFQQMTEYFRERKAAYLQSLKDDDGGERTNSRLSEVYKGRVGDAFSRAEIDEIMVEGDSRYAEKIPPGFKDAENKAGVEKFGDLIIWKEMVRRGAETNRSMIFVTDDAKEDWWRIEGGRTLGPRPELIEEFWKSGGQRIQFYTPQNFLLYAQHHGAEGLSQESITEVGDVSQRNDRAHRILAERRADLERERDFRIRMLSRTEKQLRQGVSEVPQESLLGQLAEARMRLDEFESEYGEFVNWLDSQGREPTIDELGRLRSLEVSRRSMRRRIDELNRDHVGGSTARGEKQLDAMQKYDRYLKQINDLDDEIRSLEVAMDDLES